MDVEELVKVKGLKGKQNKKKWNKNIDVSGLFEQVGRQNDEETRKKFVKPLIVEDTTKDHRQELDPNRFKNRVKSQPKPVYDNSFKRDDLIQDGMQDLWGQAAPAPSRKKQELVVPAIIKPPSGHSYNPTQQDIEEIVDEVIDYEKSRPRKIKPIKKLKDIKIVPRSRNKTNRAQYLQGKQRRLERASLHQIKIAKKIAKENAEKQRAIEEKIKAKEQQKQKLLEQAKEGKVREGPKIGKKVYKYKQYIPSSDEVNKKLSKVGQSEILMKQQFDSIFRRGIVEPRSIKVHKNRTRNKKVVERFQQD